MRYGVCASIKYIKTIAESGFDYIEPCFGELALTPDSEFKENMALVKESGILCEAANCFVPRELALNTGAPDYKALGEYIERGMSRGVQIGLKTVVFGSGAARRIPENGSFAQMFGELVYFIDNYAASVAKKYGVEIVIEPLCKDECNMINTVTEGVMLACSCSAENVAGLADIYHMHKENDGFCNITRLRGLIHHAHISHPLPDNSGRRYPQSIGEYDYRGFISALTVAACTRCSIEADTDDLVLDCKAAIKVLRQL